MLKTALDWAKKRAWSLPGGTTASLIPTEAKLISG